MQKKPCRKIRANLSTQPCKIKSRQRCFFFNLDPTVASIPGAVHFLQSFEPAPAKIRAQILLHEAESEDALMEIVSTLCKKCRRRKNHCLKPEQKVRRALVAKPIAAEKIWGSRPMIKPSRHRGFPPRLRAHIDTDFWGTVF